MAHTYAEAVMVSPRIASKRRSRLSENIRSSNRNEDNGNRCGRFFGGENTGRSGSNDDIRFKTDKLFRQGRETVKLSFCISVLDDNILSFNVTKLIESLPECVDANPVKGRGLTT